MTQQYITPKQKSSNIEGLAYDQKGGVGYVEFIGGRRYAYSMAFDLFQQMQSAKSVGTFFAAQVKGKCQQVWQGERCNNSPCSNDAVHQSVAAGQRFCICEYCRENELRFRGIEFGPIQPVPPKAKKSK